MSHLQDLYESHHASRSRGGFSILESERGNLFSRWIGHGKNVLDIGCRDGTLTAHFSKGNSVTGADIDEALLARLPAGIKGVRMDAYGDWKELGDVRFDAVVAGEILEHLYHPSDVVAKAVARLVPEGIFVGSVPNAFSLKNRIRFLFGVKRGTPLSDPTHINQFHIQDIRELLGSHFKHVEVSGLGRAGWLARRLPGLFAFDLVFRAANPITPMSS